MGSENGKMSNHAVCCVGWDAGGWIFKNAWGAGWGEYDQGCWGQNGYGHISEIERCTWMDPVVAAPCIKLLEVQFIEPNNNIWEPGEQVSIVTTLNI